MLTDREKDFFHTFGYAVAGPTVLEDVVTELHAESERAIHRAYPTAPERTLLLPVMSERNTWCSLELTHDQRLLDTATALLGSEVVVKPPKVTRFSSPTNWHRDCYMPIAGVKFAVYFGEPGSTIPFDLIPTSHSGPVRSYVDRLFGRASTRRPSSTNRNPNRVLPSDVPSHTVRLAPGQLLMFDLGLWHANLLHEQRLQWAVTYLAAPKDEGSVENIALHLGEFFEYSIPYPADAYPYFPDSWWSGESESVLCRTATKSGVLTRFAELYGQQWRPTP